MRDLTRCIAAGFYRMGIGIGTEKTPVELRARIGKNRCFSALCKPPISFCAPHGRNCSNVNVTENLSRAGILVS
jgi:hypothetical protein